MKILHTRGRVTALIVFGEKVDATQRTNNKDFKNMI